jgi:NTE family protein
LTLSSTNREGQNPITFVRLRQGYGSDIVVTSFLPWWAPRSVRPLAACFGGGGAFGIGFDMGVAQALIDSGIPVDEGPMLGTSAGAWTAAALAKGVDIEQIWDSWSRHPKTTRPPRVIEATESLFGNRRDARVSGMVIHVPLGTRLALSGGRHRLADVVAASSSPPRVAAPHRIRGHRYIDAGVTRGTSADRAQPARVLVVVAPVAGRVLGRIGQISEQLTRYEMARWKQRTGGEVLYIRPDAAIAGLAGRGTGRLLDIDVGQETYRPAYELGLRCAERFRHRHPAAAAEIGLAA